MAQSMSFATEIPEPRPQTTQTPSAFSPPEQSFYLSLKSSKEKARRAMLQFQSQLLAHHKTKVSLDQTTHRSLIKRTEFLKLYSNKKAMLEQKEKLQAQRQQLQRYTRKSIDLVKRRKLEQQLQHILRQNQEQDHIYQLQISNRKQKETFFREKERALQRERMSQHHDEIKRRSNEFNIRKKIMHTSLTQRSKNNYRQKVQQELALIHQYEDIMGEVEHYFTEDFKIDSSTICQTLQPGRTLFITTKNTLQ